MVAAARAAWRQVWLPILGGLVVAGEAWVVTDWLKSWSISGDSLLGWRSALAERADSLASPTAIGLVLAVTAAMNQRLQEATAGVSGAEDRDLVSRRLGLLGVMLSAAALISVAMSFVAWLVVLAALNGQVAADIAVLSFVQACSAHTSWD
ncbi:MAG: hypothetical protein ACRCYR_09395 [Phycicoccus sp.]